MTAPVTYNIRVRSRQARHDHATHPVTISGPPMAKVADEATQIGWAIEFFWPSFEYVSHTVQESGKNSGTSTLPATSAVVKNRGITP